MVDEKHIDIAQLNEASEYREKCEREENKTKKQKNSIALFCSLFLLFAVFFLVIKEVFVFDGKLNFFISILSFGALALGIAFLVRLIVLYSRFSETRSITEEARKMEGTIAQHLFKLTLSGSNS